MSSPPSASLNPGSLPSDPQWNRSVRTSLILHGLVLGFAIVQALVFPTSQQTRHAPTLRVDLVGLPDQLKTETRPTATQTETPVTAPPAETKKAPERPKEPVAVEDSRGTRARTKPVVSKKTPAKKPESSANHRQERLQDALARAKALARVREAYAPQKHAGVQGAAIKGNQVSAGTTLTGEARENAEAHYYDTLRDRLIENWALPVWLSRQNLRAQVQVRLDARGRILLMRFRQSSGNTKFDEEVQRAIRASEPFPPPPAPLQRWVASEGVQIGFPL